MSNSPAFLLQPELLSVRQSWLLHFHIRAQKGLTFFLKPLTQIQAKVVAAVFWIFSIHGVHWRVRTHIQKSRKKDSMHSELQHFRHKVSCGGIQLLHNSKKGGGSRFPEKKPLWSAPGKGGRCRGRDTDTYVWGNVKYQPETIGNIHLYFAAICTLMYLSLVFIYNGKKLRTSSWNCVCWEGFQVVHLLAIKAVLLSINIYIYLSTMSCLECKLH